MSSLIRSSSPSEEDFIKLAWTIEKCIKEDAKIEIYAHLWGYTIELNARAVEILDNCLEYLMDKLGRHFKGELHRLISFCIQFKRIRLVNAVDRSSDGYVRMVSPWVIPFALVVVRGGKRDKNDQHLWFTVWDENEKAWGEDAEFHENQTRNAPALAQHGDFLYCVHRGMDSDDSLWWTVYSTNNGWSDDAQFPHNFTEANPSLVEYQNTLYCFHRGSNKDHALYYCTFDAGRNTWNADIKIMVGERVFESDTGCAVAVFNGKLHLVYQVRPSHGFNHLIFDGTAWLDNAMNPIGNTADTPALVAYQNKLLLVYRGGGDNYEMWYATYDGTNWRGDEKIPNTRSLYGPGMAVFNNKVFMVHRGANNDETLWYCTYGADSTWSRDTQCTHVCTGAPPALACYTDPKCNTDNYESATTAEPQLICVHRGGGN